MPSPYVDVIVLSCLLGKAMRADRSYPAYPSVSRRAQVAGTGVTLAMTGSKADRRATLAIPFGHDVMEGFVIARSVATRQSVS